MIAAGHGKRIITIASVMRLRAAASTPAPPMRTNFIRSLLERPDLIAEIKRMTPLGRLADLADTAPATLRAW